MSNIKLNFLLILLVLCSITQKDLIAQTITGSGNMVTNTVSVSTFNTVLFYPDMGNIVINEGSSQSLSFQGDDNILDSLNVYVSGDSLYIDFPSGNTYNNYTLNATITVSNLKSVDLFSLGELTLNDATNATDLRVNNHGEGNINVHEFSNVSTLEVINNASGEITMNADFASLTNYTVYVHGSGNFYGCQLNVDSCLVQNFGTGHAYVKANTFLNATIFGSGNIEYLGTPTLYQNNFGTGSILVNTNTACSGSGSGSGSGTTTCVDGDLNIINSSISVNVIENIKVNVDVTLVEISQGATQSITISGDSNVLELVEFNVTGDTLHIVSDSCFQNHTINIAITTPNIERIDFYNSGEIIVNDFETTEQLILHNHSDGNMTIGDYQDAYYLNVNNYGEGNITITSDFTFISSYSVNNYGAGNYYGCLIDVASCYALNAGSGLVSVSVSGYLDGTIESTGNIEYYSDPVTINSNITGTGMLLEGTNSDCTGATTGADCIEGDGNSMTQVLNLSAIENLVIDVDFTTFSINQGTTQNITVTGDNNILDSLDFTVVGDTLFVEFLADTCFESYDLSINITLPTINSIAFFRTGEVDVNAFTDTDSLIINNYGNASVQLGEFLDITFLDVNNTGSGSITFNEDFSNLNTLYINNTGAGDYNGCELSLDTCYAVNTGSGTIALNVSDYLDATIESSGNIEYYGTPFIQSTISGSGQVIEGSDENCLNASISVHESIGQKFTVFPNPATQILNVTHLTENSVIKIVNVLGEEILSVKSQYSNIQLDISDLEKGTYIIRNDKASQIFIKH